MFRKITDPGEVLALVGRRKPALVSFDLFDTLVYRTVIKPKDVFRLQGRRLRRARLIDISPAEWLVRRKQAERHLARLLAPGEVQLAQIYDALLKTGALASAEVRDAALALELAIEREVIHLFPFAADLLAAVKQTGARVVVLSDICLPLSFIRELLEPVSKYIDDIYCSAEVQCTKRHGQAYALLKKQGKVLHIGDNPRSDRRRAWQNGIEGRLIEWERQAWLKRSRAELALLQLRGIEVPPLADPGCPPRAGTLDDLATRWSMVLFDFLLDLRKQAQAIGATDIWLASRDCESLWAVVREVPEFFGPIAVRYIRTSRKATRILMAGADPERYASWWGRGTPPVEPEALALAQRYYLNQLRPETRRILFVDMITRGRLEASLRVALPPSVELSGYYFSLNPDSEASDAVRVYLPWRHDWFHGSAIELLSGFREGTCLGFRAGAGDTVEPVLENEPQDGAPPAYLVSLRAALARLMAADVHAEGDLEGPPRAALMVARRKAVRSLAMFPDGSVARSLTGWHYASPQHVPAHDVVYARANRIRRFLALASRDNRWPAVAIHSVAPPWLVTMLQWTAVGRMMIKNRLDGVRPRPAQMVGGDDGI